MDLNLPDCSGAEVIARLKTVLPDISVVVLTVYNDTENNFKALRAGACGYLLKETEPGRLLECIRELHAGGAPMSPEIARKVVMTFRKFPPPRESEVELSSRQIRILQLLAEGHSYKHCAQSLALSLDTIRFHVRKIYDRLHVHSRSEAVWKGFVKGIVQARRGAP